jgi:hypothetical protein
MVLFGLANTTPEQFLVWMVRKGIISSTSEVAVIPTNAYLKSRSPTKKFLLATSVTSLRRNLNLLNSKPYSEVSIFIFGSALALSNLKGLHALDYKHSDLSPVMFDVLSPTLARYKSGLGKHRVSCSVETVDFLKLLTDSVKLGSLLNPLMTFIYTLPSSTHQTPAKIHIARAIYYGHSQSKFLNALDSESVGFSPRVRNRLVELLMSDIGVNYTEAFATYRSHGLNEACSKHNVNSYELAYLASIVESK